MRLHHRVSLLLLFCTPALTEAFVSPRPHIPTSASTRLLATKKLGLVTFDLDDTLYPVAPVLEEANLAFARAMSTFGYEGVEPQRIVEMGRRIREEIASKNATAAAILSHTEIRELAIRRVLEDIVFERKVEATADDWATKVEFLSPVLVENCRKWASTAVSNGVVEAVLNQWEMERHHAAERHLYPEVIEALKSIKEQHPGVIFGAVTDGRANPRLMTFTLAPFFDFTLSWEDDQGSRQEFFRELSNVDSKAQLTWIYEATKERYRELAASAIKLKPDGVVPDPDEAVWIHVGDDLAYDVGGSAACGAKTILVELADKYKQTARLRFEGGKQPSWSQTSKEELEARKKMNEVAKKYVDETVQFLTLLPEAVEKILEEA